MGVYFEDISSSKFIVDAELDPEKYLDNQEKRYNEQMIRKWKQRHLSNPSDYTKAKLKYWRSQNYDTNRVGRIILDPPPFTPETAAKIASTTAAIQAKKSEVVTQLETMTPEDLQRYIEGLDQEVQDKLNELEILINNTRNTQ